MIWHVHVSNRLTQHRVSIGGFELLVQVQPPHLPPWYVHRSVGDDGQLDVVVAAASEEAEGESCRRRALCDADPVASTPISAALREGLRAAELAHGRALHERLGTMDAAIAAQLQAATSAPPPKVPSM